MNRYIVALVSAALCTSPGASISANAGQARAVWRNAMVIGETPRPFRLVHDQVTVDVTQVMIPYDDENGPGEEPDARITVIFPGLPAFVVPDVEQRLDHHGIGIGVGRLSRTDNAASVVIGGYTGGMHCCTTTDVVTLVDGKPQVVRLPEFDAPLREAFPRDLDGDGTVDFVIPDDSFLYAFTSYNASVAPPHYYNIVGGALVDVSREPRMARAVAADAEAARKDCETTGESHSNGACAAYAASMALLGKSAEGIAYAVAHADDSGWLPEPCTVPMVNDECPEGKTRTFRGFEEALRWFLKDNGYSG